MEIDVKLMLTECTCAHWVVLWPALMLYWGISIKGNWKRHNYVISNYKLADWKARLRPLQGGLWGSSSSWSMCHRCNSITNLRGCMHESLKNETKRICVLACFPIAKKGKSNPRFSKWPTCITLAILTCTFQAGNTKAAMDHTWHFHTQVPVRFDDKQGQISWKFMS